MMPEGEQTNLAFMSTVISESADASVSQLRGQADMNEMYKRKEAILFI